MAVRLTCLVLGYAFGLIQTAYFIGRMHGIDIRNYGSGNAGSTNAMRTMGRKAGLLTFAGDVLKCVCAVLLVRRLFGKGYEDILPLLSLYASAGVILGHNFPFYLKFQGGKGIACTSGVILAVCPLAAPLCLVLFIISVAVTRYVSLGSVLVLISYLIQAVFLGQAGYLRVGSDYRAEFYIVSACFAAMGIWRHRANIVRLLNGTENKIGKKEES